jgi:hypothetical protein
MTIDLREALERLDSSIDRLEGVAEAMQRRTARGGIQNGSRNRNEVLARLDTVIGRLETFLSN